MSTLLKKEKSSWHYSWLLQSLEKFRLCLAIQNGIQDISHIGSASSCIKELAKTLSFNQLVAIITTIEEMYYTLSRNAQITLLFLEASCKLIDIFQDSKKNILW